MCERVCATCVQVFMEARRECQVPVPVVISGYRYWDSNMGPLEEKEVLLATKPSL